MLFVAPFMYTLNSLNALKSALHLTKCNYLTVPEFVYFMCIIIGGRSQFCSLSSHIWFHKECKTKCLWELTKAPWHCCGSCWFSMVMQECWCCHLTPHSSVFFVGRIYRLLQMRLTTNGDASATCMIFLLSLVHCLLHWFSMWTRIPVIKIGWHSQGQSSWE